MDKLPISTGDPRISEPSTVGLGLSFCTQESIPCPSPSHIVRMCCRMPTPCQVIKSDTIRKRQSTGAILARIVQQCLGRMVAL